MSKLNFFNSYFYGKSGKRDFTQADLPANRLQLLRDVFFVRKGSMVGLNMLYILFWLPAIFWTFLNLLQVFSPAQDVPGYLNQVAFSYVLVLCPLIALTGPFNMGVSYVLRNWARDEHSFVLSDFASALKSNWKQGLLFGIINGAVPLLAYICARFYLGMVKSSVLFYLPLAIALLAALIWYLASPLLPMMIVTYDLGFFAQVKNAVLLSMAELPRAVLVRLSTLIVPILLVIFSFTPAFGIAGGAAMILYAIIWVSLNKLIDASFANYLCEKYLNPKIEGARTGIGLRPEEDA